MLMPPKNIDFDKSKVTPSILKGSEMVKEYLFKKDKKE